MKRPKSWWAGTKPTDLVSVIVALASIGIAIWALHKSDKVATESQEAAAPVLAAAAPDSKKVTVQVNFGHEIVKRADRMYFQPATRRIVVPVVNAGSGTALTVGEPILVSDCTHEPALLPSAAVRPPLGNYVLANQASGQLAYFEPEGDLSKHYVDDNSAGTLFIHTKKDDYWYSSNYSMLQETGTAHSINLLIWYTDEAQLKLRWTCLSYLPAPDKYGSEWALYEEQFGEHAMVAIQPDTR